MLGRLALICIKYSMKLTYSKPILHEHSNKKRPPSTVCDEMCFHGRSRKTIISLQHLVRSVVSKLGAVNFRDFRRYFGKFFCNRYKRKTKAKENKKSSGLKNLCFAQSENRGEHNDGFVACWPSEERKQQTSAAPSAAEIKNTCENNAVE